MYIHIHYTHNHGNNHKTTTTTTTTTADHTIISCNINPYIYIYIYIHIHIYTHIYTYIHICTHIYTYIHIYTHIYTYIHTYIHICTHPYIHTHIHTHIHIHTCQRAFGGLPASLGGTSFHASFVQAFIAVLNVLLHDTFLRRSLKIAPLSLTFAGKYMFDRKHIAHTPCVSVSLHDTFVYTSPGCRGKGVRPRSKHDARGATLCISYCLR